jgi:hypothetical protein
MREFLTPVSLPMEPGFADIAPAWARSVVQVEGRAMLCPATPWPSASMRRKAYHRVKKNDIDRRNKEHVIEVEGNLPPPVGQTVALFQSVLILTKIVFIQVSLDVDPAIQWIISNNLIRSAGILDLLFACPGIDMACPRLGRIRAPVDRYFDETSWQSLEQEMVRQLMHGPRYFDNPACGFQGPETEATKCMNEFLLSLVEGGEQDALLFVSIAPWSDWFHAILGDWTMIALDRRRGLVSVLVMSESD